MGMRKNCLRNESIIKPITLLILLVIFTCIEFMATPKVYVCMLVLCFVNLFMIDQLKAVHYGIAFSLLYGTFRILSFNTIQGHWIGAIFTMIAIIVKLFPLWLIAGSITSCSANEIMNSLRLCGVPNKLCVSVAVFFRFLPDYMYYFKQVKVSLRIRGISFHLFKPLQSMELFVVPMIYKAFETGEIITASLITKGIEYDCKKTSYRNVSLRVYDYLNMVVAVLLLGVSIWNL